IDKSVDAFCAFEIAPSLDRPTVSGVVTALLDEFGGKAKVPWDQIIHYKSIRTYDDFAPDVEEKLAIVEKPETSVSLQSRVSLSQENLVKILCDVHFKDLSVLELGELYYDTPEEHQNAWEHLFDALRFKEGKESLLLKLRTLTFCGPDLEWTDSTLLDMLSSRRDPALTPHRLERLELYNAYSKASSGWDVRSEGALARLWELCEGDWYANVG
ncbi:hypothetical protein V5O48_009841, partial [Marasmius crinis-equi]